MMILMMERIIRLLQKTSLSEIKSAIATSIFIMFSNSRASFIKKTPSKHF